MQLDFLQKQYDFELEQRNSIVSATNIPIVGITVVSSALSVTLIEFQYREDWQTYGFCVFWALSILCVVFSMGSVFASFHNYEYQKLPLSSHLIAFKEALYQWHYENANANEAVAKERTESDFFDYLCKQVSIAADWNGKINIHRSTHLQRATTALGSSLICFLVVAAFYANNKLTSEEKIHKIDIAVPIKLPQQERKPYEPIPRKQERQQQLCSYPNPPGSEHSACTFYKASGPSEHSF